MKELLFLVLLICAAGCVDSGYNPSYISEVESSAYIIDATPPSEN